MYPMMETPEINSCVTLGNSLTFSVSKSKMEVDLEQCVSRVNMHAGHQRCRFRCTSLSGARDYASKKPPGDTHAMGQGHTLSIRNYMI